MTEDFYKDRIIDNGIDVMILNKDDIELVNRVIYDELCVGKINEDSRKEYVRIINDMKEKLISKGYDPGKLEMELEKQGFERGANIRNKKYKILEKRKYEVDDSFPKIISESFKGDKFPDSVIHIEYTVDLDGLEYTTW